MKVLASSWVATVASAAPASHFWSGKNGDAFQTGASPHTAPSDLFAGPAWSYRVPRGGLVRSHPLIDKHLNVYLCIMSFNSDSEPGGIVKFDAAGVQLWNYTAGSKVPGGPAMQDGFLMFGTAAGYVVQLDTETGQEMWSVKIGLEVPPDTHAMTVAEGYIVATVRTEDPLSIPFDIPFYGHPLTVSPPQGPETQIVTLNMSGDVLWRFNTDTVMYNMVSAIADGSVVVADTNGRTYRLDLATGHLLWKHESADYRNFTGMSPGGAVVGRNRVVYVTSNIGSDLFNSGSTFGRLSAYALETGELIWRQDLELPANNEAAVGPIGPDGDGPLSVVVTVGEVPDFPPQRAGSKRSKVLAFDAETGERLPWQHELHWAHAAAAGDTWEHRCQPDDTTNPTIGGDGTVYFGSMDGRVYALRDADGDGRVSAGEISLLDGGRAYQGPPGIAPGMLVVCPCDGLQVFRSSAVTTSAQSATTV